MSLPMRASYSRRGHVLLFASAIITVLGVLALVTLGAQHDAARAEEATEAAVATEINGFAQFPEIEGESTDADHKGWCDVLGFNQSEFVELSTGGGATSGRAIFEKIVLVKPLDRASPLLQAACAEGTLMPKVTLELVGGGGESRVAYYKVDLIDARIATYNVGTTGQRNITAKGLPFVETGEPALATGMPVEELSIDFRGISVVYTYVGPDGQGTEEVAFEWDLYQNRRP